MEEAPHNFCYPALVNWFLIFWYVNCLPWQIPVRNKKKHSREICYISTPWPSQFPQSSSQYPSQSPSSPSLPLYCIFHDWTLGQHPARGKTVNKGRTTKKCQILTSSHIRTANSSVFGLIGQPLTSSSVSSTQIDKNYHGLGIIIIKIIIAIIIITIIIMLVLMMGQAVAPCWRCWRLLYCCC